MMEEVTVPETLSINYSQDNGICFRNINLNYCLKHYQTDIKADYFKLILKWI